MFTKRLIASLVATAFFITGCASTGADPNYLARLDAQKQVDSMHAQANLKKAEAEVARMVALQKIGETGDTQARQMAVMALALAGAGGGGFNQIQPTQMPNPPESDGDRALKWASIFAGPVVALGTGYFGYKMGVAQSNNQAATTIAGYNTFGQISTAGYTAAQGIATSGFASNGVLAGHIQAPQPNITLSGTGVIGSGTYTHTPTTTTNTNSNNRTCNGGTAGNGAGTTTGGAGGPGGSANC